MQIPSFQNPIQLIGPAVLISIVVFLVHFFGKIISDQKPFSDERSWEIEFSGINFFIHLVVFPGILGFAAANYIGSFRAGSLIHFLLAATLGGWLLVSAAFSSSKIYSIKIPWVRTVIFSWAGDEEYKEIKRDTIKINRYVPLWLFSVVFVYIVVLEYIGGHIIWLTIISTVVFFNFVLIALNYSLTLFKPLKVDIYFIEPFEPMKNLILLKINADNIRLRDRDKIVILNKSQILRIESSIEQN